MQDNTFTSTIQVTQYKNICTERKITQCKLHAGMRPYVHNKYPNWLALDMIQRFNTRTGVLKRTRDVILSSNIIFNSKGSIQRRNEGLPKMQRAATQLINIQTFYSQRAVRLKIIVKYCHFCFEDLVFSKVCLDNCLV